MKDLKLRVYAPVDNKLSLIWELVIDKSWRKHDDDWFIHALKDPMNDLDYDQEYIRIEFTEATGREGIIQGNLLCIGAKQCYIIY